MTAIQAAETGVDRSSGRVRPSMRQRLLPTSRRVIAAMWIPSRNLTKSRQNSDGSSFVMSCRGRAQIAGAVGFVIAASACLSAQSLLSTHPLTVNVPPPRVSRLLPPPLPSPQQSPPPLPSPAVSEASSAPASTARRSLHGASWKHTLPAHIARSATWFEHERTLTELLVETTQGQVVWLTYAHGNSNPGHF